MNKQKPKYNIALILILLCYYSPVLAKIDLLLGESLKYTVSFRGLLSSMIWLDVLDINITSASKPVEFEQQWVYHFSLYLTTEAYKKSELLWRTRYRANSYINKGLTHSLLLEYAYKDKQRAYWFSSKKKQLIIYREQKKQKQGGILGFGGDWVLEKPQPELLPPYLAKHYPNLLKDKVIDLGYSAWDYLSFFQMLRIWDFSKYPTRTAMVYSSKGLLHYQIAKLKLEPIEVMDKVWRAIKFRIVLENPNEKTKASKFYFWLSDDNQRLPLKIQIESSYGEFGMELKQVNHF